MSEKKLDGDKESKSERALKLYRNMNALGATAVAGVAAVIPGPNVLLAGYAWFNAGQAGGAELFRRYAKKRRNKKKSDS